jgi:hypothetical protein
MDVEQYHIFTTPGKDKRNDLWHEAEVNAVMLAEPQFMIGPRWPLPGEGKELPVQCPVYYLTEVLTLSKQNYPYYQKVTYDVYMAAKKLKHYFEEHPITVVSTTPLSEIIGCKDASGRVAKWAIELAAHTIQYKPRTTIKSQIIADFFADWGENQYLPPAPDSTHWRMHFDGSKLLGGLGAGVILTSPKGDKLQYVEQRR